MLNSAPQPTFTIGGPLYLTYKIMKNSFLLKLKIIRYGNNIMKNNRKVLLTELLDYSTQQLLCS
jgi:hypothetical protein